MTIKIAALLGLKDEVELLPRCIDHLYSIGVDLIVARDCGSTDGSAEILSQRQSDRLWLAPIEEQESLDNDYWAQRESDIARSTGADWVLFLDADEFWLPATGSLKTCAHVNELSADVLSVRRYNVPLGESGPCLPSGLRPEDFEGVDMFVNPRAATSPQLESQSETPWSTAVPVPKMMARPSRIGPVRMGHHGAHSVDAPLSTVEARDIVIAHLPFSSFPRFERKVENIIELLATYPSMFTGQAAWHWKRWARIAEAGGLRAEFDLQRVSLDSLAQLKADGVVRTAASVLSAG